MSWINVLMSAAICTALLGCSDGDGAKPSEPQATLSKSNAYKLMRSEFMDSCRVRPEYARRKKTGTLDNHCKCIFKTAMTGRSEDEQMTIAFYLYGEKNKAFQDRFRANPPDLDAMVPAVKAIEKAVKKCPL